MIKRLRNPEPFGKAGLTVAILALVLAVTGAAFAAAGLNGKQKKEVEKIAKKFAGKPGAPGANGTNGTNGAPGANGKDGTNGSDGTSATTETFSGEKKVGSVTCKEGGIAVKSASPETAVCNGQKGQTGFTETLPANKTETGTWAFGPVPSGIFYTKVAVPFAIPLAAPLDEEHVHYVTEEEQEEGTAPEECEGTAAAPTAESGYLCVYEGQNFLESAGVTIYQPQAGEVIGAGTAGAVLFFVPLEEFNNATGSFAVTG